MNEPFIDTSFTDNWFFFVPPLDVCSFFPLCICSSRTLSFRRMLFVALVLLVVPFPDLCFVHFLLATPLGKIEEDAAHKQGIVECRSTCPHHTFRNAVSFDFLLAGLAHQNQGHRSKTRSEPLVMGDVPPVSTATKLLPISWPILYCLYPDLRKAPNNGKVE